MPHERAILGQSADQVDVTDPQSQLADYYQWIEPNRGSRVYINFETAERLQIQALHGLDLNGGVEVGGFLLGRTEFESGRVTAVIEDFEPVPFSYSNGPLYSAAGSDTARFMAALERYKARKPSGPSVVGYYRSHKREDLYLSTDDLGLIRLAFPAPDNIFLLIKPLSMGACTGGFFCWENGSIQSEFTLEVPFAPVRPPSLAPLEQDDILCPKRLDLSEEPATIPPALLHPENRSKQRYAFVAAALGVVLSLGFFGYRQVRQSSGAGRVSATPEFTARAKTAPIPVLTHSEAIQPAPVPSPSRQTKTVQQQAVQDAVKQRLSQPAVPFIPREVNPTQTMAAAPDLKLEEAPSLPGGTLPGKMRMSELPVVTTAIKPPPAIVPPGAEPGIPAAEPVPSQPSGRTITFVGPQITYRVNPSISLDVRSLVAGETQIDVAVKIDATGKVTDAQVTSSRGAAARLVAAEAIKAARLCRFQPARENDHPVQSRMVLTFRFRQ